MLTKEAWQSSYDKWCKAEDKTRRKVKWNNGDQYDPTGWKSLRVVEMCSYCKSAATDCIVCSLFQKGICSGGYSLATFWRYECEMSAKRTNWKRALELCTKIREAIEDDGREWGYYKEGN